MTIQRTDYKGWADSYRLSNGTVEVVVVPAVARIMRYGYVGGPNLLWENPEALGKPAKPGDWPNFGGDKAWPWPQDEWEQRTGSVWPPPAATDQVPFEAEKIDENTLRLTSPRVIGYGIRIVRDIRLAPTGTLVTIQTRFDKERAGADFAASPWTITQVPYPDTPFLLRQVTGTTLRDGIKTENPDAVNWKLGPRYGSIFSVARPTSAGGKAFFDADVIGAVFGDTLFTVRADTLKIPPTEYQPGDRAQIYQNDAQTPYAEFEFTAPLRTLKEGESQTLTTVWTLRRLAEGRRTAADAAPFLEQD